MRLIEAQGENILDSFHFKNVPAYLLKSEVLYVVGFAWEDKNKSG